MTLNVTSSRNYGIDFLRILSTYMIVVLHILGQGGILSRLTPGSVPYNSAWFLETASYCVVNCYALISGYVGYGSKFKFSRLLLLWFQIIFYTVGFTAFFSLTHPEFISSRSWLNAFFPIINIQYWYLTTYFGMYLFIPMMNLVVEQLEEKCLRYTIILFFIFFVTIPAFKENDLFSLNGGFSVIWFCMLYIIGGYIKKYSIHISAKWCFIIYILSVSITWLLKINGTTFLLDYASPTILVAAITLLLIFANTNFKSTFATKIITLLAPATLSVYIIHVNPFIWDYYMINLAAPLASQNIFVLITGVFIISFIIYLACSIFDFIRIWLFQKLKLRKLLSRFDS